MSTGDGRGSPAAESEVVDAVVQSGSAEIPYRRTGRGRAVLLLADASDPAVHGSVRRMAESRLVIQPRGLPEGSAWSSWLTTLVEGLGLDAPDVIVGPEARAHLDAFAASHPGWVGRISDIETIDP